MKTIDELFEIKETKKGVWKLQGARIKYLNKEKGKLSNELMGVEYSSAVFKIKLKADRRMQRGQSYLKPDKEVMEAIRTHLLERQVMDCLKTRESISGMEGQMKSYYEFDEFAMKSNLFANVFPQLIGKTTEEGFFECKIIPNNFAWISKDEKGVYRYYTKRKNGHTMGLNIYDLMEISDGLNVGSLKGFQQARKQLARIFNISLAEEVWKDVHRVSIEKNLMICEGSGSNLQQHFPILTDYLRKYLPLIQFLNQWALNHLDIKFVYNDKPIMFLSTTHIEKMLNSKFDQTTISRVINMLTLIGLIFKVPHNELSQDEIKIAKGIESGRSRRWINFYQIPQYDEQTLMNAEKYVRIIINCELKDIAKITEDRVRKHFGEEQANQVYLSSDGKKKRGKHSKAENIIENPDDSDIPF